MTRINTNVSSLNAQKTLARSNAQLQEALTRLSTGLRINSGKDDPAGLIASEVLRSDNSERANQMIATADSALGQISALLNDIRGLVSEAANVGALSNDQIAANQLQVDSSLESINRIAQTTSFQGRRLIDGSLDFVSTAGSVSTIADIQIDQANLGATGQIAVDIDISAAAAQATITSASGEAAAAATINFAAGTGLTFAASNIDVHSAALGDAESGVTVSFVADSTAIGSEIATYDAAAKTLVVQINDTGATTADNVAIAINALHEWDATVTTAGAVDGSGADAAVTGTTGIDLLTVTAATAGTDFNDVQISVTTQNGLGAANPTAVYNSTTKRLLITIDDTTATTLANINTAVNNLAEFGSTATNGGSGNVEGANAAAPNAVANTGITGYLNSGFSASTNATATLFFAAGAEFAAGTFAAGASAFDVNATALGTSESSVTVSFVADTTAVGSETAVYDSGANTLKIHINNAAATTVAAVVAAIDALDEFSATIVGAGAIDGSGVDAAVTGTTGRDSLAITATIAGADYNSLAISVVTQSGLGAANPTVVYDATANTLVITIDDTDATELTAIDTAIDALSQFNSAHTASGSTRVVGSGADANAAANTGTSGGNTLLADLVMEINGTNGTEVFSFETGASVNQIVSALNLVSDATGVSALQSAGLLTFTSTAYGSSGLAAIDVITEGSVGTFEDALSSFRENGTDIVATVNGITASGDGNKLSINTATLDLSITVSEGSSTDFEFSITGGGAVFQLGPDVVSNQQAAIGIQSVNTARLGGVSGRLYQLGAGQSAALDTDTTTAAAIVDEVISKVTSLRGRLGAFQRTTLQTNIDALNDTLEALTGAESAIRDADFAAESAALTRAQILVQSGVSVLAIANSNPQNVLALLR
jgi:flagellin